MTKPFCQTHHRELVFLRGFLAVAAIVFAYLLDSVLP